MLYFMSSENNVPTLYALVGVWSCFWSLRPFTDCPFFANFWSVFTKLSFSIFSRSLSNVALVFRNACRGCYDNCVYALYSSKLTALVDVAYSQISVSVLESFQMLRFEKQAFTLLNSLLFTPSLA